MRASLGYAALRLALFLIVAAVLILPWVSRRSAEFVVLVLTIGAGLLMATIAAVLIRKGP